MSCLILNGDGSGLTSEQLLDQLLPGQNINFSEFPPVWSISNKYYSAEVRLEIFQKSGDTFVLSHETLHEKRHKVGASIFFVETFNGSDESLKLLGDWQKFVTQKINGTLETAEDHDEVEDGPEVQLIVAKKFASEDIKTEAFRLAVKLGAEIIDFSEADDEENEDDVSGLTCHNNYGSKRVIEALQTCSWKDLESDPNIPHGDANLSDQCEPLTSASEMEDFETLFAQFATFRSLRDNLPDEDRKAFAERIATAFFSSLGGESDDDDDCDTLPDN